MIDVTSTHRRITVAAELLELLADTLHRSVCCDEVQERSSTVGESTPARVPVEQVPKNRMNQNWYCSKCMQYKSHIVVSIIGCETTTITTNLTYLSRSSRSNIPWFARFLCPYHTGITSSSRYRTRNRARIIAAGFINRECSINQIFILAGLWIVGNFEG